MSKGKKGRRSATYDPEKHTAADPAAPRSAPPAARGIYRRTVDGRRGEASIGRARGFIEGSNAALKRACGCSRVLCRDIKRVTNPDDHGYPGLQPHPRRSPAKGLVALN